MESSIYREGRAEGLAEGLMAGQLAEARGLCLKAIRKWRPRVGTTVLRAVEHCTDLTALEEVTLNASEWGPSEIVRRLTAR